MAANNRLQRTALCAAAFAWTLTVDPLTAALGVAHLQLERRLGPRLSLYGSPSLRLYDGRWTT